MNDFEIIEKTEQGRPECFTELVDKCIEKIYFILQTLGDSYVFNRVKRRR